MYNSMADFSKQRFPVLVRAITMEYICNYIYIIFSMYIYFNKDKEVASGNLPSSVSK